MSKRSDNSGAIPSELTTPIERSLLRDGDLVKRFRLLLRRYKISPTAPDKYVLLATCLAVEAYRGFQLLDQPAARRGRPTKWTFARYVALDQDVRELCARPHRNTIADACRHLPLKDQSVIRVISTGRARIRRLNTMQHGCGSSATAPIAITSVYLGGEPPSMSTPLPRLRSCGTHWSRRIKEAGDEGTRIPPATKILRPNCRRENVCPP